MCANRHAAVSAYEKADKIAKKAWLVTKEQKKVVLEGAKMSGGSLNSRRSQSRRGIRLDQDAGLTEIATGP